MSIIRMEVEEVVNLASRMNFTAEDLYDSSTFVRTRALQMNWTGPSHDQFMSDLLVLIQEMLEIIDEVDELGFRLRTETDQWEFVGSSLGTIRSR